MLSSILLASPHFFLLHRHHECIIAELQDLIENWNVLTDYVEDGLSAGA
jgi:hypothetical protein